MPVPLTPPRWDGNQVGTHRIHRTCQSKLRRDRSCTGWTEQPWPGPDYGRVTRAPPASYTEWIRVDELMPRRRVPPSRGWRLALYKATFGLVNVGPSVDEADAPVDQ